MSNSTKPFTVACERYVPEETDAYSLHEAIKGSVHQSRRYNMPCKAEDMQLFPFLNLI